MPQTRSFVEGGVMYEARSFARQGKQYSKMRDLSAEYTDLYTPMYDIETGNDVNLIAMYIKELLSIVHRGYYTNPSNK